ncbi:MAG: ABC transporter permease [Vicinamibacterales bacterium]
MLTRASLRFYAATNVMVVIGVAVAVAVLAGALLVGSSVRDSLREIALGRLGATDVVIASPTFFRGELAGRLGHPAAPLIVVGGAAVHEPSRRTAARVVVYGIDDRFGKFHGVDHFSVTGREALISPALARELGARAGDGITVRVAKPTDVPLSTLQGRRENTGERIRVTVSRVLDDSPLAEFSLDPSQGPVLAVYVPMARLQRDLELGERVNTMLVAFPAGAVPDQDAILRDLVQPAATLDDVALSVRQTPTGDVLVESRAGFMPAALVAAIEAQASREQRAVVPVLTYVANAIRIGDRSIPYSTVAAIDIAAGAEAPALHPLEGGGRQPVEGGGFSPRQDLPIWLNEWAANDLSAHIGDAVTLDYYLWSDEDGLRTSSASFTLRGIVPMGGIGGDRTLTPDYPGISDAADITSWDPPFPVDLKMVRSRDEDYWDAWRAAPKAFIPLRDGQRLWGSRFGNLSSLRIDKGTAPFQPPIDPAAAGFVARRVRADALGAAQGTTDFGAYFLYFSFFLVVSALLLAYLFFALGLEQRTREVGLLSAVGFSPARIRGAFLREGAVLATAGAVVGAAAAIAYAAFIMYGLRTWWVGAVGTTALRLHVAPEWVIAGAAGAVGAGLLALWLGVRALVKRSTRALLLGSAAAATSAAGGRRLPMLTVVFAVAGVALAGSGAAQAIDPTAAFFGAGAAALIAGLCASALVLRRHGGSGIRTNNSWAVVRLGVAQIATRPTRTVLSLSLVAFACFVLVAVGAFRKDSGEDSGGGKPSGLPTTSGLGGYTLIAESVAPLMHDPNTASGRAELGIEPEDPALANVRITRFRLRPGDEASCLTLYKPTNPRIIAPEARFLDQPRFAFNASLAATGDERANPWRLLARKFDDGAIAAIADQTTLIYSLHLGVGDDFILNPDSASPTRLRIVASLADSMLQSELVIGEDAFVRLFPHNEGYRVWLIDAPAPDVAAVTTHLEDRLSDFGLDVEDASLRWASYHRVENTYLATFQALGALGLLLGTIGLGAVLARNVLERRREIALLRAVGFSPFNIRTMVLSESLALVVSGVLIGTASAVVAVLPAIRERAQAVPAVELSGLLIAVVITGMAASLFAVRLAVSTPVVAALKSE